VKLHSRAHSHVIQFLGHPQCIDGCDLVCISSANSGDLAGSHPQLETTVLTTLELFRDEKGESKLRRIVCNIGTTGSASNHTLVHRSMQGLFREVGLTPNFVWDENFPIPEVHLLNDQRKALEEAKLDHAVEQIQRAQRGSPTPVLLHPVTSIEHYDVAHMTD
jgi:hypothetical protein